MMRFLSCFSGIEAASVAFEPLGWRCVGVAEVDKAASRLLAQKYPDVPNLGDVTSPDFIARAAALRPDILVGGPPCQDFSVSGLRAGIDGDRGNLTLRWVEIIRAIRPSLALTENVPGWLSVNRGHAFGAFLAALVGCDSAIVPPRQCGGRWSDAGMVDGPEGRCAWRTLDAQFFGLAQRRRRVFVVFCPGDGADPAEILFERQGLRWNPSPRREARQGGATDAQGRAGIGFGGGRTSGPVEQAACLTSHGQRLDFEVETFVAHALRGDGFDASDRCSVDGCGRKRHAGGMCASHYSRFKRHGDPLAWRVNEGEPLRFLSAHIGHDGDGCIVWPYAKFVSGYGSIEYEGKTQRAHRVMCMQAHGAPPSSRLDAAHSCGCRLCINPRHLRWASRTVNMADAIDHGTTTRGERHGNHKLVETEVREIFGRLARGETHEAIANLYGVSRNAITDIAKGKNWAWLKDGTGRGTPLVPVQMPPDVAGTLKACGGKSGLPNGAEEAERLVPVAFRTSPNCGAWETGDRTDALTTTTDPTAHVLCFSPKDHGADAADDLAPTMRAMAHSESHPNAGWQLAVAFAQNTRDEIRLFGGDGQTAGALAAEPGMKQQTYLAFELRGREGGAMPEGTHETANIRAASGGSSRSYVADRWVVRRLTPDECEALQGFPRGYTAGQADGPRYKQLGNSWAVNVARWIGERIDAALRRQREEAA